MEKQLEKVSSEEQIKKQLRQKVKSILVRKYNLQLEDEAPKSKAETNLSRQTNTTDNRKEKSGVKDTISSGKEQMDRTPSFPVDYRNSSGDGLSNKDRNPSLPLKEMLNVIESTQINSEVEKSSASSPLSTEPKYSSSFEDDSKQENIEGGKDFFFNSHIYL